MRCIVSRLAAIGVAVDVRRELQYLPDTWIMDICAKPGLLHAFRYPSVQNVQLLHDRDIWDNMKVPISISGATKMRTRVSWKARI